MSEIKRFKIFEEQIGVLSSNGLIIEDEAITWTNELRQGFQKLLHEYRKQPSSDSYS